MENKEQIRNIDIRMYMKVVFIVEFQHEYW